MTEQEKQEIKQEVLNAIKSESQGVTELEEVSSLDGVKTLPALRGTELVSAPVSSSRRSSRQRQHRSRQCRCKGTGGANSGTRGHGCERSDGASHASSRSSGGTV